MPCGDDDRKIYATDEAEGWRSVIRDDEKSMDLDKFPKLGSDRAEDVSKVGRPKFRPPSFAGKGEFKRKGRKEEEDAKDAKKLFLCVFCFFASFAFKFSPSSRLTL